MGAASLLQVEHLVAGYAATPVLRGVSLALAPGEILCVVGANGSGKSTLVRCLMGFLPPWEGRILLDGEDLAGAPPQRVVAKGIGAVLQGRTAFATLTVRDNLELGGYLLDRAARQRRLEELLERFPALRERQRLPAGALGGGEQQLLEIARALMPRPRVLVLDEPTIGLAPPAVERLLELIQELQRAGLALLAVEQLGGPCLRLHERSESGVRDSGSAGSESRTPNADARAALRLQFGELRPVDDTHGDDGRPGRWCGEARGARILGDGTRGGARWHELRTV